MNNRLPVLKLIIGCVLIFGILSPSSAHAGLMQQITELLSEHISPEDEGMAMLRGAFGDFALDPFNSNGGNGATSGNVLGEMFKKFNMYIFTIAMIWFAYTSMSSLAMTMHEGVILGRKMSTVWMPIRVAFGSVSLMPVFGGWAFCQALMMISATLGGAGANSVSSEAIKSSGEFNVIVNPMGSVKQANLLKDVESYVLLGTACMVATEKFSEEIKKFNIASTGVPDTSFLSFLVASNAYETRMDFPGKEGPTGCGSLTLKFSARTNDRDTSAKFGFRISGINYEQIRKVSMDAHQRTLSKVAEDARIIITGSKPDATPEQIKAATDLIASGFFGSYSSRFQGQLETIRKNANGAANNEAISDQLLQQMQKGGWATLGVWYGVFAEVNEAMNEMLDPTLSYSEPKSVNSSHEDDVLSGVAALVEKAQQNINRSAKETKTAAENANGNINAVGEESLGQYIMGSVMSSMSSSTGASQTVNPIIAFKNIGDNAIGLAQVAYLAVVGVQETIGSSAFGALANMKDSGIGKKLGKLGSKIGKKLPFVGSILGVVERIASDAAGILMAAAFLMFAAAAAMAYYIPMIPFIQWFAALLQWFVSVVESLVGSALWALAHFDSDGEGMGQRASYGYLYMLNNFARPIIMTFAFFIASAAVTILGTYLFKYYGSAVASAHGNSITGFISIVAYLIILAVLGITLVNGAFSALLNMADSVIGFIGTTGKSAFGHDVENRVSGLFINAARGGAGVLTPKGKPGGGSGGGGTDFDLKSGISGRNGRLPGIAGRGK